MLNIPVQLTSSTADSSSSSTIGNISSSRSSTGSILDVEGQFAASPQAIAAQKVFIAAEVHKFEMSILRGTYKCKNENCGSPYVLLGNIGTWRCFCHYGYISNGKWSCCGQPSTVKNRGCLQCDHWPTERAPVGQKFRLPMPLFDYIAMRGGFDIPKNRIADDDDVDEADMIRILRSAPLPMLTASSPTYTQ